jgi:Mg-chelatase subunit ChlD
MNRAVILFSILFSLVTPAVAAPLTAAERAPRMDVVFLVDTTGSMGDEIAVVKKSLVDMIAEIEGGKPRPDVRFGLVVYRDRGDEYVTRLFDLTDDTDAVIKEVNAIEASGGGDEPESVNEALHVAINDIKWDRDVNAEKTIFLIGDAPPNVYENDYTWQNEIKAALKRDIIINTIGASGLSSEGVDIFTKIAKGSEGTFQYLTYKGEYVSDSGETETVMMAGGGYYSMDDKKDEGLWKLGAGRAEEKGLASKVPAPVAAEPATGPDGTTGGGYGTDVAIVDNNLDSILVSGMKEKMIEKGVTYGTPLAYDVLFTDTVDYKLEDREFTATTADELKKIAKELGIDYAKIPAVDFKKKSVIGIAADGNRGLYGLTVKSVTLDGGTISATLAGMPGKIAARPLIMLVVPKLETLVADWYFVK